jgi:type IV pilus biogenesis protein CpaD/CtpE
MPSIRFGFIIGLALLVAACVVDQTGFAPQLGVEAMSHVYDVPAGPCATAASRVRRFVVATANDRPESVRVSIEGHPGGCARTIARAIEQAGVEASHIRLLATASAPHGVRVRIERLVVTRVDCHISDAFNRGMFMETEFDPALGCSTKAAIGGMVADPEDLEIGKGRMRAEGEPAASAVAALRSSHDTQAANSGEDHHQSVAHPTTTTTTAQ